MAVLRKVQLKGQCAYLPGPCWKASLSERACDTDVLAYFSSRCKCILYDVEEVGLMLAEFETFTKMFLFNDEQRLV